MILVQVKEGCVGKLALQLKDTRGAHKKLALLMLAEQQQLQQQLDQALCDYKRLQRERSHIDERKCTGQQGAWESPLFKFRS